jgi:hypothetical protein
MQPIYVASERRLPVENKALAPRRFATDAVVPTGLCHAYHPGLSETLCGEPLNTLSTWTGRFFQISMLGQHTCRACADRARSS